MSGTQEKGEELRRDGYVFFRQLFSPELAHIAHSEIMRWFELDNRDRSTKNIQEAIHEGPAGKSLKTAPSHLLIDVYGKSPALDTLVDRILTHPTSRAVLRKMSGEHYKFRGYNVRLMTGSYDPGPMHPKETAIPHEWHRDSPGEFGIGIFLTDVPEGGNAGTAFIPGSHLFPYCPRWNTLLNHKYYTSQHANIMGRPYFARFNIFNRLLGKQLHRRAVEASGNRGDCYFFLNDVWHGRFPNLHGRQSMIVLIGGFPTEFPFPDEVNPPPKEIMDRLPESICQGYTPRPMNRNKGTLIHWMLQDRRKAFPLGLFALARLERLLANHMTTMLDWLEPRRKLLVLSVRGSTKLMVMRARQQVKKILKRPWRLLARASRIFNPPTAKREFAICRDGSTRKAP